MQPLRSQQETLVLARHLGQVDCVRLPCLAPKLKESLYTPK